ncbi:hypothetical protein [Methylobacterium sp. WL9]|nr:hypothetical protein [Methylobacterium sp. WL9]
MALFLPKINPDFAFGTYIEHLQRPETSSQESWLWSDPAMIADAIAVIETEVLPKLEVYGTPEGYVTLPPREHTIHYEPLEDRMLALIAAGDLDAARTIWHEKEPKYRGKTYHPDSLPHRWQMQLTVVAEPLLAGDRRALARILHGWEAANVRGTKIEPYWEPTPFPLEAGLG